MVLRYPFTSSVLENCEHDDFVPVSSLPFRAMITSPRLRTVRFKNSQFPVTREITELPILRDCWRFSFQMLSRRAPNYKSNHGMEERVLSFLLSTTRPPGRANRLVNIWRQGEPVKDRYFLGSGLEMHVLQYSSSANIPWISHAHNNIPIHSCRSCILKMQQFKSCFSISGADEIPRRLSVLAAHDKVSHQSVASKRLRGKTPRWVVAGQRGRYTCSCATLFILERRPLHIHSASTGRRSAERRTAL